MTNRSRYVFGGTIAVVLAIGLSLLSAQSPASAVSVDPDDIGGVVMGPDGPEAGVWAIAETDDLPTKFRKIVVTNERGEFVLPDLPRATYQVWVRGYGLVDSMATIAEPGETLQLTAVPASTPQEAARVYPPNYWTSLLQVPAKSEFPGTGRDGNGISPALRTQTQWINTIKTRCMICHTLGNPVTRSLDHLEGFSSSTAAWAHRMAIGQRAPMPMDAFGYERGLQMFADWTDRIAAGEVPPAPPRPEGVERNVVLTMWDWGSPVSIIHDLVSTDKRRPTMNSNGLVYGVDYARGDYMTILDPAEHSVREIEIPKRDRDVPTFFSQTVNVPSPFWGEEAIWQNPGHPHNPMMDSKGRVWITSQIRRMDNQPAFCKEGSSHPSAQFFPLEGSQRHLTVYDPETEEFTLIDTCTGTHHLQFDEDPNETLYYTSSGVDGGVGTIGWLNTRLFDETGDAAEAQGWCPIILDTNGDGKAGPFTDYTAEAGDVPAAYVTPRRAAVTSGMDLLLHPNTYGVIVNPVDHSVWATSPGPYPGALIRLDPSTCVSEVYEPPVDNPAAPGIVGHTPRGVDVDRNGLIWTALAGSGHLASFDRQKCEVLNGPTATGQHCPEGWTLYESPGPHFKGVTDDGSSDVHYYNWVDQFDTFGLGENVPIANGTGSDSLIALLPETEEMVVLRVPYPINWVTRGLDGRIDDPDGGWKGRGLWATNATGTVWHGELEKEQHPVVVHFQLRPDPLAK